MVRRHIHDPSDITVPRSQGDVSYRGARGLESPHVPLVGEKPVGCRQPYFDTRAWGDAVRGDRLAEAPLGDSARDPYADREEQCVVMVVVVSWP